MSHNNYEIIEPVNSGLYGKVFKARQKNLDRIVAAKIIKNDFPHAASELEHAEALARVNHENIVQVIDVVDVEIPELGTVPAAIMQWLDGELLGKKFGGEPFTKAQAKRIALGVLSGVECMHANGISHRDLHYGNIIITADFTPKIIDIDVNQDVTLARLSTLSRDAAVNADIGHCRQIVLQCMRHARFSNLLIADIDTRLQNADTLKQVREVTEEAFELAEKPESALIKYNLPSEWQMSISGLITQKIEQREFASVRALIASELKNVIGQLLSNRFPQSGKVSPELVKERVQNYEDAISPLIPAMVAMGYWGNEITAKILTECIEAVSNAYTKFEQWSGTGLYLEFRKYPPLLMLYAAAYGAYSNNQLQTLYTLLTTMKWRKLDESGSLTDEVYLWKTRNRKVTCNPKTEPL